MKWELHVPHHNPPNNPPGWYFVTINRKHDLISFGPYPTREFCLRVIATEKPCSHCNRCPVFHDEFEEKSPSVKRAEERWGRVLCQLCTRDFTKWHKKQYGRPPDTLDVLPKSFTKK